MSSNIARALVVGGTSGIGYGIACRIAQEAKSATVIISGRTKPSDIPHANIEFRKLDASSMSAIKTYTDAYKSSQEPKLDLLVLTQGIMTMTGRAETPEGIDRKMALHYYGRQQLIRELLPALQDDAKVLIVLGTMGSPDNLNWTDLDLKSSFGVSAAAQHCMAMNDAMIQYYAEQQKQTGKTRHFVHASPGVVNTSLGGELPWYLRGSARILSTLLGVSPQVCGERMLKGTYECATLSEKQGRYWSYMDSKGKPVKNKASWDDEQTQKVASHTWKLIDGVSSS
ncbi:hypothetical protein PFICI_08421 [Pestalotiopsis fici W106-1]|uniref:Uncharacterized protein n=1 Tax=Pestalotiopsis fici (strain W106-1 / CGMCC3.15140) TaxID=1229662 RepID=W3X681_PESFW|nr:uncharacterized protein PFICI_08421 [Pestalotiopsis fici W106-1]ETS80892.1 hypothetical protein PFICI_08421 [Pestalotiopsis fici W106-1]